MKLILREKRLDEVESLLSASSDLEILRAAMIAELDTVNLYIKMAGKVKDEKIKKVLLDIAYEEKVHIQEFQELIYNLDPDYGDAEEDANKEHKEMFDTK